MKGKKNKTDEALLLQVLSTRYDGKLARGELRACVHQRSRPPSDVKNELRVRTYVYAQALAHARERRLIGRAGASYTYFVRPTDRSLKLHTPRVEKKWMRRKKGAPAPPPPPPNPPLVIILSYEVMIHLQCATCHYIFCPLLSWL